MLLLIFQDVALLSQIRGSKVYLSFPGLFQIPANCFLSFKPPNPAVSKYGYFSWIITAWLPFFVLETDQRNTLWPFLTVLLILTCSLQLSLELNLVSPLWESYAIFKLTASFLLSSSDISCLSCLYDIHSTCWLSSIISREIDHFPTSLHQQNQSSGGKLLLPTNQWRLSVCMLYACIAPGRCLLKLKNSPDNCCNFIAEPTCLRLVVWWCYNLAMFS